MRFQREFDKDKYTVGSLIISIIFYSHGLRIKKVFAVNQIYSFVKVTVKRT